MEFDFHRCAFAKSRRDRRAITLNLVLLAAVVLNLAGAASAQEQASPSIGWNVTIVLPPRLMAGHAATLAVLDVDGKLAPGVHVELSGGDTVVTDRTGRAAFKAPANHDYVVARSSGATAAALIDPAVAENDAKPMTPSIASTSDRFWVCGAGLQGKADEDSVQIDGENAPVIAASPVCIVTLPPRGVKPGPAKLSVDAPGVEWTTTTTLVSLQFTPPQPALKANEKGRILIAASGSTEKLQIALTNGTPGVLKFEGGDMQELLTSGGSPNSAAVRVQAISSGDFSFSARLLPAQNPALAKRFLQAAEPLAPKEMRHKLSTLARRLERRPQDVLAIRAELDRIKTSSTDSDLSVLLEGARDVL